MQTGKTVRFSNERLRKGYGLTHLPRRQLFTKTDLAKFVAVWEKRPHEVSLGAQKNFAAFARRIGQHWKTAPDDFNEGWYRESVAKAIVFRATERLVTEQPWYQGGYRANIVAHAIAKTAHDVGAMGKAVDFQDVWRRQTLPPAMAPALVAAAESVHDVLIAPPEGISNVTEWAKKQACWNRVSEREVAWPQPFLDGLISTADRRDEARNARREQRELKSVEAQIVVVRAGPAFWAEALAWGRERELLTPREVGVLGVAANPAGSAPTERQAAKAVEALTKLQAEGYAGELPAGT
ncbi:MAG: AIPR family protein [Deltaproteobacteria bacterium]|nr:AIPR family protein [Deltaproteobacteria bacterium]